MPQCRPQEVPPPGSQCGWLYDRVDRPRDEFRLAIGHQLCQSNLQKDGESDVGLHGELVAIIVGRSSGS